MASIQELIDIASQTADGYEAVSKRLMYVASKEGYLDTARHSLYEAIGRFAVNSNIIVFPRQPQTPRRALHRDRSGLSQRLEAQEGQVLVQYAHKHLYTAHKILFGQYGQAGHYHKRALSTFANSDQPAMQLALVSTEHITRQLAHSSAETSLLRGVVERTVGPEADYTSLITQITGIQDRVSTTALLSQTAAQSFRDYAEIIA